MLSMAKLEMTDACNGMCMFCSAGCDKIIPSPLIPLDDWLDISARAKDFGINTLNLSGGELMILDFFPEAVKGFKKQGFTLFINTNATINVKSILPYLTKEDMIVFSIHAHTELQDEIIGVEGALKQAKKNLELCKNIPATVAINMVLTTKNYHLILDNFNHWNDRYRLDKFAAFIPVQFPGSIFDDCAIQITKEMLEGYTNTIAQIPAGKLAFRGAYQNLFLPATDCYFDGDVPDCGGGRSKILIKANGDVYPCDFFVTPEFYCGNILEDSFQNIWENGKGFKPFRELKLPTDCQGCTKSTVCYGGCRSWTLKYAKKGVFSDERDYRCKLRSAYARNRADKQM